MLLPKKSSFVTTNLQACNEEGITQAVKNFLHKHTTLIKIYVSTNNYEKIHRDQINGVPVYAGSGVSDHEITFVS